MTDQPTTSETLPVPWQDESGDYWWCEGEIEPHRFLLAVAAQEAVCRTGNLEFTLIGTTSDDRVPDYEASMRWVNEQLASVARIHCRQDPEDDERWLVCKADDEGATPFTRLSVG